MFEDQSTETYGKLLHGENK